MNLKGPNDYSFLAGENQVVTRVEEDEQKITAHIKTKKHVCKCPHCGHETDQQASTYKRHIQDTPIRNKGVFLEVTASKYVCQNPECPVKVFTEKLPNVKPRSSRTVFLDQFILAFSIFLSDYMASLILSFLGVVVSHDTVRRLRDRVAFKEVVCKNIGIDDVAIKKGQQYATAVYDLDTGNLLCLLEGRGKEEVLAWLKENDGVTTVARDRASAYSAAISEALPDCIQVADRFHLIDNLISTLKDLFYVDLPSKITVKNGKVQEKPQEQTPEILDYDNSPPLDENGDPIDFDQRIQFYSARNDQERAEKAKQKVEKIRRVKELRAQDKTYNECAAAVGISANAARTYALMGEDEIQNILELKPKKNRKTL